MPTKDTVPLDDPLSGPMDVCIETFRKAGWEEVFPRFLDYYMNAPPEDRCYLFKGPDWMTWARHIDPVKDPLEYQDFPRTEKPGDAWLVYYLQADGFKPLFRFFPYPLPYIAFGRAAKGRFSLTFHSYESIRRKCLKT